MNPSIAWVNPINWSDPLTWESPEGQDEITLALLRESPGKWARLEWTCSPSSVETFGRRWTDKGCEVIPKRVDSYSYRLYVRWPA